MKKLPLFIILVVAAAICVPDAAQAQNGKIKSGSTLSVSSLDGCWKRTGAFIDGKPEAIPLGQLRIFSGGYYTYIGQDTAHNWTRTFAGIYDIDKGMFKETTQYSSVPSIVGNTHWQDMKLTGDTLRLTFYKKMIDSTGKELPKPSFTREVVLVRMRR